MTTPPPVSVRPRVEDLTFDQYQRYRTVGSVLERMGHGRRLSVLDVGGYGGVLGDVVAELDLVIVDRRGQAPRGVVGDATLLPFGRDTFDVVVSVDSLEHVAPGLRRSFVAELLRVSRRHVVLAAPFHDPSVVAAELFVEEFCRATRGGAHGFLAEHLDNGLPELAEVRGWLASFGARIAEIPNGYLPRWTVMMAVTFLLEGDPRFARLRPVVNRLYNRTFAPHDACEPCYRRVLVCDKLGDDPAPLAAGLTASAGGAPAFEPGYALAFLMELVHHAGTADAPRDAELLERQVGFLAARLHQRDLELAAERREVGERGRAVERMRQSHADLEGHARKLEGHARELEGVVADGAAHARRLEEALADARAERERVASQFAGLEKEYRKLESHARAVEGAIVDNGAAATARSAALEQELAVARDQLAALEHHARNLGGIVERLSETPLNRLARRLRGG